jgi:predicted GTPase
VEDEADLETLCRRERIDRVLFAYSDIPHADVMHLASRVLAEGADFALAGPKGTMLRSNLPVIAVSAVRTGCGKSQTARWLSRRLREHGRRVAVLRHPMPYGDLEEQRLQRFATFADLDAAHCSVEEREEYEPHLTAGNVVYAGVDYGAVLDAAESDANIILWDGGNNDFPFIKPDLHIVLVDALRPDQATTHHPGETVLRMADVIVVNKVHSAPVGDVERIVADVRIANPGALVIRAASPVRLDDPDVVRGRRVIVVEDAPTITHGGMAYGAGYIAASALDGVTIVDPRSAATPGISAIYDRYPHIGPVLPAMGYGDSQLMELEATINAAPADVVVAATPADLAALIRTNKPVIRARYEYADAGEPTLDQALERFLKAEARP